MSGIKEALCRLCRKNITDNGFQVIDSVIRDMLDILLLKLKFSDESKEVICNACKRKLKTALEFKSTCLTTDHTIIPHVDCKEIKQFDLGEIYVKENGSGHLMGILGVRKICRLCMQLIKGEIRVIGEEELEAIHNFVPEMYIRIIKDPVLCTQCFDSLSTHNTFLKNCSEVEQNIPHIFEGSATESRIVVSPSDLFIKNEKVEKESEIKEEETSIKSECVDIKSENEEEESHTLLLHSNNERFKYSNCTDAEDEGLKYTWKHENRSIEKYGMKSGKKWILLYKCDKCSYESGSESYFRRHYMEHKKALEVYKCEISDKSLHGQHRLRHKDPSKVQIYRCNDCNYKTKYKNDINYHARKHNDSSRVQMYKCDACNYESKYKFYLISHQLKHKDPSEVQMYHCNECNFKTKYKNSHVSHLLRHKNFSQVYKCDVCDYESKYKSKITNHQLTHKGLMYQCDECDFKTKYKKSLEIHLLRHKNSSQVQMYKCDACDYESKYKSSITNHQLTHKGTMYQCDECDFKTKYKQSFKNHLLRHKNLSQVQMYKCDACDYESKYKSSIANHQLTHKGPMYQCNECYFKTKYKKSLAYHLSRHKNSSSANV